MMFSKIEIEDFKDTLRIQLRASVETGDQVLPAGFAFYRVSPRTQLPQKSMGSCYGRGFFEPSDMDVMAEMIQLMARAGKAHAAGMAVVSQRDILPNPEMFGNGDNVAVIYMDNIQGAYEVWFAPVIHRPRQTPTLGEFVRVSDLDGRVPYLLPMELYGPVVGNA